MTYQGFSRMWVYYYTAGVVRVGEVGSVIVGQKRLLVGLKQSPTVYQGHSRFYAIEILTTKKKVNRDRLSRRKISTFGAGDVPGAQPCRMPVVVQAVNKG